MVIYIYIYYIYISAAATLLQQAPLIGRSATLYYKYGANVIKCCATSSNATSNYKTGAIQKSL